MKTSRALLVSVTIGRTVYDDSAQELALLVKSDNLEPCGLLSAKRDKPDPAYFIGSGKVEELGQLAREAEEFFGREFFGGGSVEVLGHCLGHFLAFFFPSAAMAARSRSSYLQAGLRALL